MKRIFVLLTVCLVLLVGCVDNDPATDLSQEDNSGTQVIDESDSTVQSSESASAGHDISVEEPSGDVVEIKEKMFIAQTNDIYYNTEDYLGKTIKYEGIFDVYEVPDTDEKYYSVIRYGPGCCGVDANAGFEVIWDNEYPDQNDWVEVIGVLEEYEEDGYKYLRLVLTSLTVLSERGAEYVSG